MDNSLLSELTAENELIGCTAALFDLNDRVGSEALTGGLLLTNLVSGLKV